MIEPELIGIDLARGDDFTSWCRGRYKDGILHITGFGVIQAREVSARRRRKLQKRGEHCVFSRKTVNGKCRYTWQMER